MSPENWLKIKEIFHAAVELAPAERGAFLDAQNIGGAEMREQIERLLSADEEGAIEETPIVSLPPSWREIAAANFIGQQIGNYEIVREIGRGGMGVVFEAVRRGDDFSQTVALKLLKRGLETNAMLKRFRQERKILASLVHPNVARLLDGGMTADGTPFFTLEYVEGEPVDEYCEEKNLSVDERLQLFRQVCAAVSFAHSRLVIHRDLKPSNILVTGDGTVKLLDFGIAKILSDESAPADGTVTKLGMMTPAYASPEQVSGEIVTTASDVYALGLILYELLANRPAYEFPSQRADEIARVICEIEPVRPSSVVTERPTTTGGGSERRTTSQRRLTNPKSLRGDLDNIVLKALRKAPARRYATVEQFSEDIERHLKGLPVIARPDTLSYRLEKFVKRHRLGVMTSFLLILTVFAGVGATVWQAVRAERQRALAEKRFNQVRELANNVMFKYHDEIKDLPGATRVRGIMVEDALKYLDNLQAESGGDDALTRELAQAYMRVATVQGRAYEANLGDSKGAAESYQKAIRLLETLAADSTDVRLLAELRDAYVESSRAFFRVGEIERHAENLQKAFALSEKIIRLDPHNIEPKIYHARSLVYRADTFPEGEFARKLETYRQALEIADEASETAPDDQTALRTIATATHRLQMYISLTAVEAKKNGQPEREKTLLREALGYAVRSRETQEKVWRMNPENPLSQRNVAAGKLNEGKIYRDLGEIDSALRLPQEALAILLSIAATDARNEEIKLDLKEAYEDIALVHVKRGEIPEALANFRRAVEFNEAILKKDPENYEFWIASLRGEQYFAHALRENGEHKLAKQFYENALARLENKTPEILKPKFEDLKKEILENLSANHES
jgi:serine/threonine protein kinase/tetratricopeptide (TPR) repeat protein